MSRANSIKTEVEWVASRGEVDQASYLDIDRALRQLAMQKARIEAEEARWLRLADAQNAWRKFGYSHGLEYLEDVFGYAPRTATERLRVARDLGALPQIEDALRTGQLSYSVVRELTRVSTADTESKWLAAARGLNLRQVEQLVAGKRKGSEPTDQPDPKLIKHGVWMDLDAESFAIFRQMRTMIEDEHKMKLDDKAFVMELGRRMLAGMGAEANGPAHTIHVTTCRDCKRGWQDGGGVRVEIDPAALERAQCDAILCDDENGGRLQRQIPQTTWRRVMQRDERSCRVPGCRASRNLDVHHIVHRANGGDHRLENLIVLCSGHHKLHHEGLLEISGRAPDAVVFIRNGRQLGSKPHAAVVPSADGHASSPKAMLARHTKGSVVRARPSSRRISTPSVGSEPDARSGADAAVALEIDARQVDTTRPLGDGVAESRSLARAALQQAGYKASVAARAVELAVARVGTDVELAALIKEALRHCG